MNISVSLITAAVYAVLAIGAVNNETAEITILATLLLRRPISKALSASGHENSRSTLLAASVMAFIALAAKLAFITTGVANYTWVIIIKIITDIIAVGVSVVMPIAEYIVSCPAGQRDRY